MIHLQLNFSLLILDKILMEAIASVASMIPYSPPLNEVFFTCNHSDAIWLQNTYITGRVPGFQVIFLIYDNFP
jgi:hypothetical protein